jgi:hypothetical protein
MSLNVRKSEARQYLLPRFGLAELNSEDELSAELESTRIVERGHLSEV